MESPPTRTHHDRRRGRGDRSAAIAVRLLHAAAAAPVWRQPLLSDRPRGVRDAEKWVLAALVVLYNPLVPIELGSKLIWSVVNIATVVWFWSLNRRPTLRGS